MSSTLFRLFLSFSVSSIALAACVGQPSPGQDTARDAEETAATRDALAAACICPPTMPDTEDYSIPDAVASAAGQEGEFQCFGACGASCNCAGRTVEEVTVQVGFLMCTYEVTTCNTHPFCQWHDTCYKNCDEMYPGVVGDGSAQDRTSCYRACDGSCFSGNAPSWAWCPPELAPGAPPGSYGLGTCAGWALSLADSPSDGTIQFSRLLETNAGDGLCPAEEVDAAGPAALDPASELLPDVPPG
jgi:hypothetical protein